MHRRVFMLTLASSCATLATRVHSQSLVAETDAQAAALGEETVMAEAR